MVDKEFYTNAGLNLYDYHARQYEPAIGRFTMIDPLAENYYSISPYAYCANNPIKYIDPDGRLIRTGNHLNGSILFNKTEETDWSEPITLHKEQGVNRTIVRYIMIRRFAIGFVYANDGTPIPAVKTIAIGYGKITTDENGNIINREELSNVKGYDGSTNCHGYAFSNGEFMFGEDVTINCSMFYMPDFLKSDGYTEIGRMKKGNKYRSTVMSGASYIVLYKGGRAVHSAKLNSDGTFSDNAGYAAEQSGGSIDSVSEGHDYDEVAFYGRFTGDVYE